MGVGVYPTVGVATEGKINVRNTFGVWLVALFLFFAIRAPAAADAAANEDIHGWARLSWNALQCSVIGEIAKNEGEQERLFSLGYESGLKFLKAYRSSDQAYEQFGKYAPAGFLVLMRGPSDDFIMGRIFEFNSELMGKLLHQRCKKCTINNKEADDELLKTTAVSLSREKNCSFIK